MTPPSEWVIVSRAGLNALVGYAGNLTLEHQEEFCVDDDEVAESNCRFAGLLDALHPRPV